jgi:hypothetical protein
MAGDESSDNLPMVRQQQAEISRVDTDSWVEVMRPILALAEKVYDTDFVPKGLRGSEAATAAAMLYGREVGLPPMTSLNVTHVVEGKPGISAEGMRAMVYAAGHELEFVETTGAICTMRGRRRGQERWTPLTWTIDMARAAGLTNKSNWKSYPRALLQARCTTELCRMVFPDVIHGFRSVEELEDMSETDPATPVGGPAEQATTTVQRRARKGVPRKTAAPALSAAPQAPAAGPPLPGEPGFDESTDQGGASGDGASASVETAGNDSEGAPSAQPEPVDVTDAEALPDEPPADEPPAESPPPGPRMASRAQMRLLMAQLGDLGVDPNDREERLLIASQIVGRPVGSFSELTNDDAKKLIDTVGRCRDRAQLMTLLDEIDAQGQPS